MGRFIFYPHHKRPTEFFEKKLTFDKSGKRCGELKKILWGKWPGGNFGVDNDDDYCRLDLFVERY